ncbi:hypothetical protein DMA11_02325 [Marinilabiliaceae bacterium JC017]|nr:hypothetical protein DMA11_02325 [Marinilabiliaceae bacterium JC017]
MSSPFQNYKNKGYSEGVDSVQMLHLPSISCLKYVSIFFPTSNAVTKIYPGASQVPTLSQKYILAFPSYQLCRKNVCWHFPGTNFFAKIHLGASQVPNLSQKYILAFPRYQLWRKKETWLFPGPVLRPKSYQQIKMCF